jgi:AAA+ ATPase superfamily predicted ATPase
MQTDLNPFVYSRPIAPDDVIDRDEETRKLLALAAGGHYVRLYAPRKYGKTSLLRRVLRDAERDEGMVPVLVDLYGVLSLADVAVRVERAYAGQLKGRIRARIDEFLQSTGLGLSLSAMGIGARLQLDPRADPLPALHALLDLPLRLEGEGRRALVVLDEFQDLAKVREMDAVLRSHIQFHGEVASYVFSGSEAGLMAQLFEAPHAPLYGQAAPLRLGRLAAPDLAAYVADRFRGTEREVGDALGPLLEVADGHPQRAMLLAHHVWEAVPPGEAATHASWQRAFATALAQLEPELDAHWQRLTTVEQKTLRAVVGGGGSPYRTALLERLDLQKASAQQALRNLAARSEVERDERRYRLVDPLFAVWIERLASPPE